MAQVEREKMLEQQAQKIKNLSSMVLYSNRDEICNHSKKDKRRDTWCPGKLTWEASKEASKMMDSRTSSGNLRQERHQGPLVPFEEIVIENEAAGGISSQQKEDRSDISYDCVLPDPCSLLKVTNRRKLPQKKKTFPMEKNELHELQTEYEDLFLRYETQRIMYEVQLDCLRRMSKSYAENFDYSAYCSGNISFGGDKSMSVDTETNLLIKQLKEQIKELEMEKLSSERSTESIIDFAKKAEYMCGGKI